MKYLQMNQISELNNPSRIDMPLDKPINQNQYRYK